MNKSGIGGILEGLRRVVSRWTVTNTPITVDINAGDEIITVYTTRRFLKGDEIMVRDSSTGDTALYIDEIIDCFRIRLTAPVPHSWTVAQGTIIQKTFNKQVVQGVYLGEPTPVPRLPAVTINANNRNSEWLTINSTTEKWNLSVGCYVDAAAQEEAYLAMIDLTETIAYGLKENIYLLTPPYNTIGITADINPGDLFVTVESTNQMFSPCRVYIENAWACEEIFVAQVLSDTVVQLSTPIVQGFAASSNPVMIVTNRFIYNSWPATITYGTVFKGSMMKAGKIDWFADEEIIQVRPPLEPQIR
jgi:hypothetical protein